MLQVGEAPGEPGESCIARVRDVMSSPAIIAGPGSTVREILQLMKMYGISSVVIVEEGRPVGIFTDKELVWLFASLGCEGLEEKALDHSNRMFPVLREDHCVEHAVKEIVAYKMRHAIVVDDMGYVIGVVTLGDIVKPLAGIEE